MNNRAFRTCFTCLMQAAFVLLTFGPVSAAADKFAYENYRTDTLEQIEKRLNRHPSADTQLLGADEKYRLMVRYTGVTQPVGNATQQLIASWLDGIAADPTIANLFESALRVDHDNHSHWMPIQKQLLPYVAKELKPGDTMEIYAMVIAHSPDGPLVLINEFQKPRGER